MDKIISGDWRNIFSRIEQTVVHSSPRYTEIALDAYEPGISSVKSSLMMLPGMKAQMINLQPFDKLILKSTKEEESLSSVFIINGQADSVFNDTSVTSRQNSHAFHYSPNVNENHKITGKNLEAFHIEFDITYFKDLLQSTGIGQLEKLSNNLERKDTYLIPPNQLPMQVRMNEIIRSIQLCEFNGPTRAMYIEAKILELIALQFEQMIRVDQESKEIFRKSDKDKLFAIKEFIEKNYLETLSLKGICLAFGLNEFKLKKGYKILFGSTVFGHIYELRMNKAIELLVQRNMSVSEIANLVGYSNVGNFSAEFKKKFGFPPTRAIVF